MFKILKEESPFFISDVADKHDNLTYKQIWNWINDNRGYFESRPVNNNKVGRPKKLYTVIVDDI